MEWNTHLTAIQGILISIEKVSGPLTTIRYIGGNEEKVGKVINAIEQYLTSKNLLDTKTKTLSYRKEVEGITLFLFLNTEFDSRSLDDCKDYSHLRNVTPQLSKCALGNIIIKLRLTVYYSKILATLPIQTHIELLEEIIKCVKRVEPEKLLEHSYILLNEIILVLCCLQDQNNAEKLVDIASEMLRTLSFLNIESISSRKLNQIYEQMGIKMICLLRLLRKCPIHATNMTKLIEVLMRVTMTLMDAVTLNVFCTWAEVSYEDQPLQMVVAGEAYFVIEHLINFKPAKELVQHLSTIASKPKTLEETIMEADTQTIITKINNCDGNQKLWFKALINNNPLTNEAALKCLKQWLHLCGKADLTALLNSSVSCREPSTKKIVLKCAENLSIEDLSEVSSRYVVERNSNNLDTGTIEEQLKVLLNKLESGTGETDDNFIKQIHLMLLQNRKQVMVILFQKCIVNVGIISCLKATFKSIKNIVVANDVAKVALLEVLQKHPPAFQNLSCYTELFNVLLDLLYFNECSVIIEIFLQLIESTACESTELLNMLQIVNTILLSYKLAENIFPFIVFLLTTLEKNRCQLLTFSSINHQIVQECVVTLQKYRHTSNGPEVEKLINSDILKKEKIANRLNHFYIDSLRNANDNNLLSYLHPTYNVNNVAGILGMLLPSCVEQEWVYIINELETKFGYETAYGLLINVLILLCQLTASHKGNNSEHLNNGLRHCLEVFGIMIKDIFRQHHTNLQDEIFLTKNVCRLLPVIPEDIRKKDGVGLIHLLSTESLQALKDDKTFVLLLVSIKDVSISQMLVKRMIS